MKSLPFFILAVLGLLIASCGSTSKTTSSSKRSNDRYAVKFENTDQLMPLFERAKKEGKLVFVDVYASWCTPCKMMDKDVFTDPALGRFMNEHFLNVKIDAEKGNGKNIASIFEVFGYPTLLFLDENGRVLERKVGATYQTEMRRLANSALEQHRSIGAVEE